jgi:hypothetical protein
MQTHHNFYAFRITLSISLRLDSPLLLLGLIIAEPPLYILLLK